MAFGIAFAVKLCSIADFFPTISMVPHHAYWEYALAAAISAMGFSMIFNIQRRLLWVVAIGGILAVCTRNFVNLGPSTDNIGLDMGLVIGSFAGSVLVSLIAIKAVHWFHVQPCAYHHLSSYDSGSIDVSHAVRFNQYERSVNRSSYPADEGYRKWCKLRTGYYVYCTRRCYS